MAPTKWQPWTDFAKEIENEILPIEGPPCKYCKYWEPVRNYSNYGRKTHYDGVTLCHNPEQHQDFSCFSYREDK